MSDYFYYPLHYHLHDPDGQRHHFGLKDTQPLKASPEVRSFANTIKAGGFAPSSRSHGVLRGVRRHQLRDPDR